MNQDTKLGIRIIIFAIIVTAVIAVGASAFNNNWLGHGGLSALLCLVIILGSIFLALKYILKIKL